MKKLLASAAGLACVLALATLVGPALSLSRYRPDPVDFEVAPGGSPAGGVVRAPKRFNLVGLRWDGSGEPGIRLRARDPDGRWSRWVRVAAHGEHNPDPGRDEPRAANSDPAWVGEANAVQYRLTKGVRGLRLHFVNVEGTATATDRARTAVRRAVNAAVVSVGSLLGSREARAAGTRPPIVSRAAWGAADCPPRRAPDYGVVKTAYVHHTVNANDYTREQAPDIVLAICRYHRNSNGWNDIGYNFLVDRFGTIYEGRAGGVDRPVVGAQAQGYNAQSTGIANIGTFTDVPETYAALVAMARLIRWKLPISGAPTYGYTTLVSAGGSTNRYPAGTHVRVRRVIGHRDTGETECPGNALYNQLPELRRLVGRVDPAGTATRLKARFTPRTLPYLGRSRARGRLVSSSGLSLAGKTVQVQVRKRRRWRTVAKALTDAGGNFSKAIRPRRIERAWVRFRGGAGLLGARSRSTLLRVRAVVRLAAPPELAAPGTTVRLKGRIGPRSRRLLLVVQRPQGSGWKRVLTRAFRGRHGRFRTSFTPHHRGQYRYYVVARGDGVALRGRSAPVILTV